MLRPVRLLMRRGFLHVDRVNQLIRLAIEMGLIQKWTDDNEMYNQHRKEENNVKALTIEHMGAAWIALVLFETAATIVFFFEILLSKRLKKIVDGRWDRFLISIERILFLPERSFCSNLRTNDDLFEFMYLE